MANFKVLPSFNLRASSCLNLVISPDLLTNLIESSLKNKSLHTLSGPPKSQALLESGIIEPEDCIP